MRANPTYSGFRDLYYWIDAEFDGDATEEAYDVCQRIVAGKGCGTHPDYATNDHDLLSTEAIDWRSLKRWREEHARAEQQVVAEEARAKSGKRDRRAIRETLTPDECAAMDAWNERVAEITQKVACEEAGTDYTEAPYSSYRYGDATQFDPNPLQFDAHMGLCPRDPAYPPPAPSKPLWTPLAKRPLWQHE